MNSSGSTTYIHIPVPIPSAIVGLCFLTLVLASTILDFPTTLCSKQMYLSVDQQVTNNFDNDTLSHNTNGTLNDSNLRNLSVLSTMVL